MMEGLITTIDQIRSEVNESRQVFVRAAGRASAALVCDTERHLHGIACAVSRASPRDRGRGPRRAAGVAIRCTAGPAAAPVGPASGCEDSMVGRLRRAAPPSLAA